MSTPVRSILKSLVKTDRLDVVTFVNYPYYDWLYSLVPHSFHAYRGDRLPCMWREDVLKIPQNFDFSVDPDIPLNIDANLIMCHDRLNQYDIAKVLSSFWHLPICLVHQLSPRDMKFDRRWNEILSRRGSSNIFFSQKIQEEWNTPGYIIPPGIPKIASDINKQKEISHIACSENEQKMIQRSLQQQVKWVVNGDFSSTFLLINTTTQFYPIHAFIAMAHGCCVMFQDMPEIKGIIEHEVDALIYKDINDLRPMLAHYKNRPDRCKEIGQKGKEKVEKMFPIQPFVNKMNLAIKQSAEITYVR